MSESEQRRLLIETFFNNLQWVTICSALLSSLPFISKNSGIEVAFLVAAFFIFLTAITVIYGFEYLAKPISLIIEDRYFSKTKIKKYILFTYDGGNSKILSRTSFIIYLGICICYFFAVNSAIKLMASFT